MKSRSLYLHTLTFIVFLVLTLTNRASAQSCPDSLYSGTATFYGVTTMGNCSYPVPATPIYTVAVSPMQYDTSATCGGCIQVTGPNGGAILSIEDLCPSCGANDLDISIDLDTVISTNTNPVAVHWKYVGCPVSGNVQIYFTNTNAFYAEIQVRNHRYPVASVAYRSGSQYISLPRASFNYFISNTGVGDTTVDLRITDALGDVIYETGIPVVTDSLIHGANQFPVCIPAGINDLTAPSGLMLRNNPSADGRFTLVNNSATDISYQISDLSGRIMKTGVSLINSQSDIQIFRPGIYLLHYSSPPGKTNVMKLIVE